MSVRAAAEAALSRIAAYDAIQPQVWISRFSDDAILRAADETDARAASGEDMPLKGLMFAVKDNIDVARLPTTAACPAFSNRPSRSAFVVERLLAAGALCIGKTNLDQFATGLSGVRSPYGALGCVFDRAFISGGSSSGSAVAVAAGLVDFALGTDTAGSGRVPAAFNHLIGFKPTRGRWSKSGVTPACRSLDCVSVFTRDAPLAARIDTVLTAYDPGDLYARRALELPPLASRFRFGVLRPAAGRFFGDEQALRLYEDSIARVASLGGEAVEIDDAPLSRAASLLYDGAFVAERAASFGAFVKANPAAVNSVVRGLVMSGFAQSAADLFDAQHELRALRAAAEQMWSAVEVLLLPTAPAIYRIAEMQAEPVTLNSNLGLYTNFVNLLDMSAIALPAGFRETGTGVGVSLIAPAWRDRDLLRLAALWPRLQAPPLDLSPRPPMVTIAVVGAHLQGMPLHWQLTSRHARFLGASRTAPTYRLYAMTQSQPPKPALVHDASGAAIALELYELDEAAFGSFTADVPAPLAIGSVTLENGLTVKGFVAEPRAILGAEDITHLGGWRAYLAKGAGK